MNFQKRNGKKKISFASEIKRNYKILLKEIEEDTEKAGTPDRKFSYKVQIYEKQQWKRRGCKMSKRYSEGINYLF